MKPEHKKYILENSNKKSAKRIADDLHIKERKVKRFLEGVQKEVKQEQVAVKTKTPTPKMAILVSCALIIILGFVVYGNSLNGEFIWDDQFLVKENVFIRSASHLSDIFSDQIGAGAKATFLSYRPVQIATYMLDYFLWKFDVTGYHFTSILVHILAALSLYWLLTLISDDRLLSLFASILFVIHPIHVAAVAYISGRADPLALCFMMLTFVFYVKNLNRQNIGMYALMLVAYAAALLSRENSMILPVLLLLYHYTFKKKLKPGYFLPLAGLAFIYILLRMTVFKSLLPHAAFSTTVFERIPGFFVAFATYIRILIMPLHLHMEYGNRLFSLAHPAGVLGLAMLASALAYLFVKRDGNRLVFFSISWFLITLFPVSNIYPVNAYMAEHWLYVPSIGFFLLVATGVRWLWEKKALKNLAIALLALVVAVNSYFTIRQNRLWGDLLTFCTWNLKYAPESWGVYVSYGKACEGAGKQEEAIDAYKKAIEINSKHVPAYFNLGSLYDSLGRKEEAIDLYKRAIVIDPKFSRAHHNLGLTLSSLGRKEEAVASLKEALAVDPNFLTAYNNLALLYAEIGKREEAVSLLKQALEIDPNYVAAHNNLGLMYSHLNKKEEAIASYKRAIAIHPYDGGLYLNLSRLYYDMQQYGPAIHYCDEAVKRGFKVHPGYLRKLEPYRK